jgi:hypothetical protein
VITRVLPLPAPARMRTGPSVARTASRCWALRPASKGDGAARDSGEGREGKSPLDYSTVTDFARFRGWSTSRPAFTAT